MAGMRDIKRRIRSIKSTQKITRAMKMVAAAKLRKAQSAVIAARPYSNKLNNIMGRLIASNTSFRHPLLDEKEEGKIGFVVITSDKGLCGGYNHNILRFTKELIDKEGKENSSVICIGRKAKDFFRSRKYDISEEYVDFGDLPDFIQARELARELIEMYKKDNYYKKLYLAYTEFGSVISHRPRMLQLLPLKSSLRDGDIEEVVETEYIYEPNEDEVLGILLPRFIEVTVYRSILEAKASELGARMTAMDSATENASELIEKLTLSYNRARQAAITTEISEVVGGAAALQ